MTKNNRKTALTLIGLILLSLLFSTCKDTKRYRKSGISYSRSFSYDSYSPSKSSKSDTRVVEPSNSLKGSAGVLTAGEVNDFSKWELWKDIATTQLALWQEIWKIKPTERYSVQIVNNDGKAVIDSKVQLISSDNKLVWTSRTDNTGKAELWANAFAIKKNIASYSFKVFHQGEEYQFEQASKFSEGINILKIPVNCYIPEEADVLFVVDATGSMRDEIDFLKEELSDIIENVKDNYPIKINLGSIFYRDENDDYLIRKSKFSTDHNKTVEFIKNQSADGGGDTPEAVDKALEVAINEMEWSENARSRILFLVLDAPPHNTPEILKSLEKNIIKAAEKGIRIIPLAASGIDKSTEYLMRSFALATNGTYVFLTDHSGVGNPHIKPTTDEYDVELLNNLLVKLLYQYLYVLPCDKSYDEKEEIHDTMFVYNPEIIEHVIIDSIKAGNQQIAKPVLNDTLKLTIKESNDDKNIVIQNLDSAETAQTNLIDLFEEELSESFNNFKYYPNPTTGKLFVEIDGYIQELYLADISGKLLRKFTLDGMKKTEINIGDFPSGMYFIKYFYKERWLTGKVILMH